MKKIIALVSACIFFSSANLFSQETAAVIENVTETQRLLLMPFPIPLMVLKMKPMLFHLLPKIPWRIQKVKYLRLTMNQKTKRKKSLSTSTQKKRMLLQKSVRQNMIQRMTIWINRTIMKRKVTPYSSMALKVRSAALLINL